jgi:PAS domain S-box-containing protein
LRNKSVILRAREPGASPGNDPDPPAAPDPRAAHSSAENEQALRDFAEASEEAIALLESDGTFRYGNARAAGLLGLPVDDLPGRSFLELVHHQDLPRARTLFESTLRHSGIPMAGEFRFLHPGGGWRHLRVIALSRLAETDLRAVVLRYEDVSDRLLADQAQSRLAAIVESSEDAIIGETLEGMITTWNQAAERLYGFRAEEVIGRSISVTVPTDRISELKTYMRRVRRGEQVDHLETVRLRKDGTRLDVSITVSPIRDEHGNITGISKSSRDITDRRRFEAELWRKNQELEAANRAKDIFLASMSHELRTPLNAIVGFTGTMIMKLPGQLTEEQDRQLKLIQVNAKHLLSLINDLLNLAKLQSGKAELQIEEVSSRVAMEEVAATLRQTAEARGLSFEIVLPEGDVPVRTDRRSLIQILINLATNAIKFTDRGGVRIEVAPHPLRSPERHEVDFRVVDTGRGIRPEDQRRLFRPFEQIHSAPQAADPGSGLGLHLSQKIANLLGGRIAVESEPGKGSVFTLTLPAA